MTFQPPEETIGDRMRRQRKRLKLEVRDLAAKADVSPATVARIEAGAVPRDETLSRLAKALGAPLGWLRDGK